MTELTFLGTGPARGIRGKGKSHRTESSALIRTNKGTVLIDVTNFFPRQLRMIRPKKIDAILLTHRHSDAAGGLKYLKANLVRTLKPYETYKILDFKVTPFSVRHSIQKGFPTVGYFFKFKDGKKLVYASDVGSWDKRAERFMRTVDILVIDGAMWGKRMIAHLDIKEVLPKFCRWPVKKIIFTQIGRSAPKHEILSREIRKICSKATPAYDGLILKL